MALVAAYTCCITDSGVVTRGSCRTTIGWVTVRPLAVSRTVYEPGATSGVVGAGALLYGIAWIEGPPRPPPPAPPTGSYRKSQ